MTPPDASSTTRPVGELHRLGQRRDVHIVEQHDVGHTSVEHLAQLRERIDLDLDLDQMSDMRPRAFQHRRYAAGDRDVVVLDQDRVIEPEAMVETAAAAHGIFLQRAQARRGLAGAADPHVGAGGVADIIGGQRRDAGEAADKVQRGALAESTARAGPEIVSTCTPAATAPPSRTWASMLISGDSF